ncbi:MAG: SPASM domain-containing protein [Myxococcales bacterium]|nr:SPASM domain-containing protein [Myxococcales bacterium]
MATQVAELDLSSAASACALWRRNRTTLVHDLDAGRTRVRGMPAHMKIELTNFCNLACPMCPHPQMQRAVGTMRESLFRKIIDESAPYLEFAYLHHLGESLVVRRIGEFIRYGRSRGVAMGLSTNATFLDAQKSRLLLESGLDFLVISLDAASAETYQRIRVGGDFATTLANTQRFFALKESIANHTTVVVQMIVMEGNRHEIDDFAKTWQGHVMIKEVRDWAGQVPLSIRSPQRVEKLPPCRMPWTEITVLWDGTVVPCANHFEKLNVLGDLRTQSLVDVWNGSRMQEMRRVHLQDEVARIPVCATCSRHAMEGQDFIAVDQLTQRLRSYVRSDLTPRPGLS